MYVRKFAAKDPAGRRLQFPASIAERRRVLLLKLVDIKDSPVSRCDIKQYFEDFCSAGVSSGRPTFSANLHKSCGLRS